MASAMRPPAMATFSTSSRMPAPMGESRSTRVRMERKAVATVVAWLRSRDAGQGVEGHVAGPEVDDLGVGQGIGQGHVLP